MCGLLGLVCGSEDDAASLKDAVGRALRCQRHRGPDETDIWANGQVIYGFNRLAIIDLEHSRQPLTWGPEDNPTRYTIIFNGEIYNYLELRAELAAAGATFATEGDTEIGGLADHVLEVPATPELMSPVVVTVPLQLLAYHVASLRGCDVDQPRNLAKSVTVE